MSAGDFLQALLGGIQGAGGALTSQLQYDKQRKDRLEDAAKMAKIKGGTFGDQMTESLAIAMAKARLKNGGLVDLTGVPGLSEQNIALLNALGGSGGGGRGNGSGTSRRLSQNSTFQSSFGQKAQAAPKRITLKR